MGSDARGSKNFHQLFRGAACVKKQERPVTCYKASMTCFPPLKETETRCALLYPCLEDTSICAQTVFPLQLRLASISGADLDAVVSKCLLHMPKV